jgi:hypothetical protein
MVHKVRQELLALVDQQDHKVCKVSKVRKVIQVLPDQLDHPEQSGLQVR